MNQKILFTLENNGDGYPPIEYELLNATAICDETFRIDNAPFFVREVSYNDVVRANKSDVKGRFKFVEVVDESTFTSISIIILDEEMDVYLMDLLRGLDCVIEYGEFGNFRMLSVAIPASTDYQSLRGKLEALENQNKLSFEELAVAHE